MKAHELITLLQAIPNKDAEVRINNDPDEGWDAPIGGIYHKDSQYPDDEFLNLITSGVG